MVSRHLTVWHPLTIIDMILIMQDALMDIFSDGATVKIAKGATLFRTQDRVHKMYVVRTGRVDLVRHVTSGERMVLNRARAGAILAEASAYSERYHCDGFAQGDSTLQCIPVSSFLNRLAESNALASQWSSHLARLLQRTRMNAEIRTLRRVSERLDAWLDLGNEIPARGEIQGVAQSLGVTREALYRELATRR